MVFQDAHTFLDSQGAAVEAYVVVFRTAEIFSGKVAVIGSALVIRGFQLGQGWMIRLFVHVLDSVHAAVGICIDEHFEHPRPAGQHIIGTPAHDDAASLFGYLPDHFRLVQEGFVFHS